MIKILIVEDEKPISDLIRLSLGKSGYDCDCAFDGMSAADMLDENIYDLVLLDIMLPEVDGFELLEYIKPLCIPVIFITAKGSVNDRVRGLRMGAEDYIVKPFEVLELQARVDVVLRRYNKTESVISIGGLTIDTNAMQVIRSGEIVPLTRKEYDILLLFARNPGTAMYRETIYERVWGGDYICGSKTVDIHVQRMRKKVGWEHKLVAVNKVGYRQEEFMGSFAHEMKTPMTSIIGYADLMRTQTLSPEEQSAAVNYIFSEGKRLESLSLKLLDIIVARNTKLELKKVCPAQLIEQTADHLRPVYTKDDIGIECSGDEGECLLEPELVKSLLINLIDNARKALGHGGLIRISSQLTGTGCIIRVRDNGPGIPPEAIAHLTEAFYRVDKSRSRAQGGAGLGLALCSDIARLHNGSIEFESSRETGTCVTVHLNGGAK